MCEKCKLRPIASSHHSHSDFSLDGASGIKYKILHEHSIGRKASVITDHGIMDGLADHYKAIQDLKKDDKISKDFKCIQGLEAYVIDPHRPEPKNGRTEYYHLTIHFKNVNAYEYFCRLTPAMQKRKNYGRPLMTFEELEGISENIVISSGCLVGAVQRNILRGRSDLARKMYIYLRELAGKDNFFVEIMPHLVTHDWKKPKKDKEGFISEPGQFVPIAPKWDLNATDDPSNLPIPDPCTGLVDIQALGNRFVLQMAKEFGDPCVISLDDHFCKVEDKVVQNAKLGNGEESWCFFGTYASYTTEEMCDFIKQQLPEVEDKQVEEWIDNSYRFIDCFNDYKMITNKERILLPTVEQIYGDEYKGRDTKEIFWEKAQPYLDRLPVEGDTKRQEYLDRVEYELSVLKENKKADFLPYFFLIEDVCNTARENGVLESTRGCLTGDTLVLTDSGFRELQNINIGDVVYSHNGNPKTVEKTMSYNIDEKILKIRTENDFNATKLTKDHKVYGFKKNGKLFPSVKTDVFDHLEWDQIQNFKPGDYLYMPYPKRKVVQFDESLLDLSQYIKGMQNKSTISDSKITIKIPSNNEISIRNIHRKTGVARTTLSKIKNKKILLSQITYNTRISIDKFLKQHQVRVEDWADLDNTEDYTHARFVPFDNMFVYMIGKWIGDGWIRSNDQYLVGYAFHKDDVNEIEKTINYFENLGFRVYVNPSKKRKLVQVSVKSYCLAKFFRALFPDYKDTSRTKYICDHFKYLDDNLLKSLIDGYFSADGCIHKIHGSNSIDTTSYRAACDLKETLLFLKTPSSVLTRKPFYREENLCRTSYKIRFSNFDNIGARFKTKYSENGYMSKILSMEEFDCDKVYDITIPDDHSYMTSNIAVHNSAGGSLALYLLGGSITNPIKFNLPFERFITHGRIEDGSMPDADTDWPDRNWVIKNLKEKYGECFALISTKSLLKLNSSILESERSALGKVRDETIKMTKAIRGKISRAERGISDKDWLYGYYSKAKKEQVKGFLEEKDDNLAETLRKYIKDHPDIWNTVLKCLGVIKTFGVHPGGVIITPKPVYNYMPIRLDDQGTQIVCYDMNAAEYVGGIKYDFLGVSTLKALSYTLKSIESKYGKKIEWKEFDHDDKVMEHIRNNLNTIFQLGTNSMKPYAKAMFLKNVVDMSTCSALCRPGGLDAPSPDPTDPPTVSAVDYFVKCSKGEREPYYIHEDLIPILSKTYGVITYQEDVLRIFRDLCGYSYADAEDVRRGIAKKKHHLIEKHGAILIEKLLTKGWSKEQADRLFATIQASANYSFNCIGGEQLIKTDKGLITIKDVVKNINDYKVLSMTDRGLAFCSISHGEKTGDDSDVLKIELDNGYSIITTEDHRFLSGGIWKTAKVILDSDGVFDEF